LTDHLIHTVSPPIFAIQHANSTCTRDLLLSQGYPIAKFIKQPRNHTLLPEHIRQNKSFKWCTSCGLEDTAINNHTLCTGRHAENGGSGAEAHGVDGLLGGFSQGSAHEYSFVS
jgi:hypothetical protein